MRHRRRAAATVAGRLRQLGDFTLRQQAEVGRDLAEAADQHRHFQSKAYPFIALGMPGGIGYRQPQIVCYPAGNRRPFCAHHCQGADRAPELQLQRALCGLAQL